MFKETVNGKNNSDDLKDQLRELDDNPKDSEDSESKDLCINNTYDKEVKVTTQNKEKKELNTNRLLLNSYWIELISKISFALSMLIYESLGIFALDSIIKILDNGNIKVFGELYELVFKEIGLKWFFLIKLSQHLSIGFFCLTNFSKVIKESKDFYNFFILTLIKVLIFYLLSITIMKQIIENLIFGKIIERIRDADVSEDIKKNVLRVTNDLKIKSIKIIGNLLGNYNNNLDKLLIGSIYYFLFSSKKTLKGLKLLFFRLLSILPIIYIIVSLIFRILNNLGKITLNLYISPLFVGPKVIVFGFFVTLLFYIKLKESKYQIFDEENYIIPNVFAKLSSKVFSIFGFIELFIGLFYPSFSPYGVGNNYFLILCAPIMILYDYKMKYEIHIYPCKKRNLGIFINIFVSLFFYSLIFLLLLPLSMQIAIIFIEYISPIVNFIQDNFEIILQFIGDYYSN